MKRWSLGILLVMAVVWIWAAKKDDRAGAEPEEIIPVEYLVLPEEEKTEKKRIALTFDDGPHPIYTPQMLELLKEEQVPATFFLLGENVELYGDVVKEIAKEGHLIGNHTYHHVQITSLSLEEACQGNPGDQRSHRRIDRNRNRICASALWNLECRAGRASESDSSHVEH